MSRLIKPVYISYRAIRRHFRRLKEPQSWKKSESRPFIFARRDYFELLQFRRVFLISFRAELRVCARCHNLACILRRHFSLFIFILPSLYILLAVAPRFPSHLCHPLHSVYVARCLHYSNVGRRRQRPSTFPSFCRTSSTSSSRAPRGIYRGRILLRYNLNNYTTRAMKSKIGKLLISKYYRASLQSLDCNFYRTKQSQRLCETSCFLRREKVWMRMKLSSTLLPACIIESHRTRLHPFKKGCEMKATLLWNFQLLMTHIWSSLLRVALLREELCECFIQKYLAWYTTLIINIKQLQFLVFSWKGQ